MATLKQVADKAGVSRRTVDRVINHRGAVHAETAERVRQVIQELGYQPDQTGQTLAAKKRKIRLAFCSIKGETAVVHEEIRQGAVKKARELEKLGITVDFYTIDRDHPLSSQESERMAGDFACDGLAVIPSEDQTVRRIIGKAEDMGIPIVFYNIDDSRFKRSCYVGCDYVQSGQLAAGLAGLCADQQVKAGIFTVGESAAAFESPNYRDRVQGFEEVISNQYPWIQIAGHYLLGKDIFDYYETIKQVVKEHPDLNLVYLVNPGDYSACRAMKKVMGGSNIRLITNDLTREAVSLLKEGIVSAAISQDPDSQGRLPLEILFEQLVFGKRPDRENYYTDLHIFIPQSFA